MRYRISHQVLIENIVPEAILEAGPVKAVLVVMDRKDRTQAEIWIEQVLSGRQLRYPMKATIPPGWARRFRRALRLMTAWESIVQKKALVRLLPKLRVAPAKWDAVLLLPEAVMKPWPGGYYYDREDWNG